MGRLEEKVALVTGAARGQGRREALRFAEEGASVIAVDACAPIRTASYEMPTLADLEETGRLLEACDRQALVRQVDIRDIDGLREVVADGADRLGPVDIVVANAGIGGRFKRAVDMNEAEWDEMLDVNLTGQWNTCRAAVPSMIDSGQGGSVILISSVAGLIGYPNIGNYVAAKHGVVGLMRTLANELGEHGIRVNSIHPTNVKTPMLINEALIRLMSRDAENPSMGDAEAALSAMQLMPVPWVEDIDVANAALFLASEEARYITGVTLPVDAGASSKAF